MSTPFSGGVPVSGAAPASPYPIAIRMPDAELRSPFCRRDVPGCRHTAWQELLRGQPADVAGIDTRAREGASGTIDTGDLLPPRTGCAPTPDLIKNARMFCRALLAAAAIALAIAGIAHAQEPPLPDAKQFLAESMKRLRSNDLLRSRYTFTEEETRYTYDSVRACREDAASRVRNPSVVRAGVDLPPPGQRQPRPAERSGEARRRAPEEGAGMDRRAGERGAERPRGAPAQGSRGRQSRAGGGRRTDRRSTTSA